MSNRTLTGRAIIRAITHLKCLATPHTDHGTGFCAKDKSEDGTQRKWICGLGWMSGVQNTAVLRSVVTRDDGKARQ
jgi:hypothetical protein